MTEQILPELHDRLVPIDSLTPYPGNARQGDLGVIIESLEHHGQYREIIVQKSTRHILAGNHTWEAARQLGWENIAADIIDVTDEQARKIVLVDNASNDHATYDTQQLINLLEATKTEDDLIGTGFTDEGLEKLIEALDEEEEPEDDLPPPEDQQAKLCPSCGYDVTNDPDNLKGA